MIQPGAYTINPRAISLARLWAISERQPFVMALSLMLFWVWRQRHSMHWLPLRDTCRPVEEDAVPALVRAKMQTTIRALESAGYESRLWHERYIIADPSHRVGYDLWMLHRDRNRVILLNYLEVLPPDAEVIRSIEPFVIGARQADPPLLMTRTQLAIERSNVIEFQTFPQTTCAELEAHAARLMQGRPACFEAIEQASAWGIELMDRFHEECITRRVLQLAKVQPDAASMKRPLTDGQGATIVPEQ